VEELSKYWEVRRSVIQTWGRPRGGKFGWRSEGSWMRAQSKCLEAGMNLGRSEVRWRLDESQSICKEASMRGIRIVKEVTQRLAKSTGT
jgi:hypothetical protein